MDNNIKVRVVNPDRISLHHGIEEGDEVMTTKGYNAVLDTALYSVRGVFTSSGSEVLLYEEEVEEI